MGSAVGRKVSAWVGERFGSSDEAWNFFLSKRSVAFGYGERQLIHQATLGCCLGAFPVTVFPVAVLLSSRF